MDRVRDENYIDIGGGRRGFSDSSTIISAEWLNSVQEEIMNVITAAGIAPSFTDLTQLLNAVSKIIQILSVYGVDTGTVNNYIVSLSGLPSVLTDGIFLLIKAKYSNTGAATLDLNGLGAKDILQDDGSSLSPGDIRINGIVMLVYQSAGDYFQLINPINK